MPEILDYEELKTRLDKSIALMEKKIAIIDDLRSNKEKTPTTEQMEILSSGERLHTEGTALALQAKSNA
ncbi:hypothetical protein [Rickettsia endosymbiont of Oedothorax gibbosus]|uniref:hypothetical protein n=1 Tax=Rickettsia endosymbiont of Oedothorax gibbosus TaxID=931099 RepID=UPI0020244562|nr:hypothetical protein [Rickettsia endosymbiont of Oedothorax gibbosus]